MGYTYEDCEVLFNCCTGQAEPDWKRFTALEISGCRESVGNDGPYIEARQTPTDVEFYGIYARHPSGEWEAITDTPVNTPWDIALNTAQRLAGLSNLPLSICPQLGAPA